ncbi:aminotransferase [Paenibacillus sp. FSL R7-0273]|uniref:aminotransferase class I/II-fold pyridoxal phosphate-dependent enzyme n=1 Tax=Paenibacillus sp. FSL R7-0273 TaxID=1536772 RepID=UPI0004F8EAE4|nr:aminotransferase class I/II-fold pyridoxal phosphate-dependent enzyme [Paenibacillus sp. FSL R7-0273]AIQ47534.1 aminotransferase [Paenibacillus sp. FSL R7-0273]OMF95908.1 LL-diaminopimelate aminotransferase [Paenibacillus sp. FSL R7-0273]
MATGKSGAVQKWRSDKLSHLGSSIFAEVAGWKEEARTNGHDIIDLGIGSPDQAPAPEIREALSAAVLRDDSYSYPASKGSAVFREQAAKWMSWRFGVDVDPGEELVSLMGSQDGLAHLALAVCNPGDLAIVPDPGYPIYSGSLAIAGVKAWPLPLLAENDFLPDLDSIPDEVWREAAFILLAFPGNPISVTADYAYMEKLVALALKWEVLIIHDLAYSEMGFDGYRPLSILQVPGAIHTAVEFHSFSKSFNMAGCRIGFMTGNREAVGALRELKSNVDYGVFNPVQEAAVLALELAMRGDGRLEVAPLYEHRRDMFVQALAEEGWSVPGPKATMFIWAPLPEGFCTGQSGRSRQFAQELLLKTGVAVIPGDAFGAQGEGFVRIALVEDEVRLKEAARRIGGFVRAL